MKLKVVLRGSKSINKKKNQSTEKLNSKHKLSEHLNLQTHFISLKSATLDNYYPKKLTNNNSNTIPKKCKTKKQPIPQPQFLKEFEQITKIYKNSKDIQNQEELSLLCLDQTLDDMIIKPKKHFLNTISNRYSQKSSSLLPSIAEKDIQEQRQEDYLMVTIKREQQKSVATTAGTKNRTKNSKSAHDNYINEFEIKCKGSHQKKLNLDVQSIIKSRSKTKSSISNRKQTKAKTKKH